MAEVVAAIWTGVKTAVAAYSSWAAAHPILAAGVKLAATYALNAALAPDVPTPQGGKTNVSQSLPKRRLLVGTTRAGGAFFLREAKGNTLHEVIGFPEGPLDSFGRAWMDEDEVDIVSGVVQEYPDRRYKTGLIKVQERLGLPTSPVYSDLVTEYGAVWTADHRLDFIPTNWVRMQGGPIETFNRNYPNGVRSQWTRECIGLAYDWRKDDTAGGVGDHRRPPANPTKAELTTAWATWEPSSNNIVWAVNVLWRHYGEDWERRFAPQLALLTAQADYCDEGVAKAGGGTEPRYQTGFWYEAGTPIKTALNLLLGTMDGWFGIARDGSYIFRAGAYYAPTVIFGDKEIFDWKFNPGEFPGAVTNELMVSFNDPASGYSQVSCGTIENAALIAKWGRKPQELFLTGSNWWRQSLRVATAILDREVSPEGSFRTPISARRGLGERFIRLRCSDSIDLYDLVVEILDAEFQYDTGSILWKFKVANPNRYDWDPDTQEGTGPITQARPAPVDLEQPEITGVTAFFDNLGTSGEGPRLSVEATGPSREDLTWMLRWKVTSDASFSPAGQFDDTDPDVFAVTLLSGFVTSAASIDVQVGYQTGGGSIIWSDTTVADTSADNVAPQPPTEFSATGGVGVIDLGWRNSVSANFDHSKYWRGTTNVFAAATVQSPPASILGSSGQIESYQQTGVAAGTYYVWITAHNAADTASSPAGPVTVTVT